MRVGICGFPGSGKSTVFAALSPGARAGGDVSFGNIKVPDTRVDRLAAIFHPKKTTYAEINFVDVAGGGRAGGAFPPDVVQAMRNVDVIAHVVRAFDNPALDRAPDPARDVTAFEEELVLTDHGVLEKVASRWRKEVKKGPEVDLVARCLACLEDGRALRTLEIGEEDRKHLTAVQLLSLRPLVTLYNIAEDAWADSPLRQAGAGAFALCGPLEAEIAQMPPEEQGEFLQGMGLGEPARNGFIRTAYTLLDLIAMLTAGEDECRAWPVRRGSNARKAAGRIHSDIERGFIRAEVYTVEDLEKHGTESALKTAGKLRVEGKEYVVQDGDVCHFRFNV